MTETQLTWDRRTQSFEPKKKQMKFLKGPVPWNWVTAASRLPGRALAVGLALWRLSGATKSPTVKLGNAETDALGVDRNAKSRALRALEAAGLVRIEQEPGRLPVVTILVA